MALEEGRKQVRARRLNYPFWISTSVLISHQREVTSVTADNVAITKKR